MKLVGGRGGGGRGKSVIRPQLFPSMSATEVMMSYDVIKLRQSSQTVAILNPLYNFERADRGRGYWRHKLTNLDNAAQGDRLAVG